MFWRKMFGGLCILAVHKRRFMLIIGWFGNSAYGFPELYGHHCIRIGHLGVAVRLGNAK